MKRLFVLILLFFIFVTPVKADYQTAYNDYLYNYNLYRQAYSDYQVAKSTYNTYRTIASQGDAITKLRAVLYARNQLMYVYYDLLTEKLNATPEVSGDYKSTFFNIKQSEKAWLMSDQAKINAASTLSDLNSVASEFENRYPQMDYETRFAIGTIFLSRVSSAKSDVLQTSQTLNSKLGEIGSSGEDVGWAQRGMVNVQNKLDLFDQKYTEAQGTLNAPNPKDQDLLAGQKTLMDANQYLRDSLNFMAEIIKGITG